MGCSAQTGTARAIFYRREPLRLSRASGVQPSPPRGLRLARLWCWLRRCPDSMPNKALRKARRVKENPHAIMVCGPSGSQNIGSEMVCRRSGRQNFGPKMACGPSGPQILGVSDLCGALAAPQKAAPPACAGRVSAPQPMCRPPFSEKSAPVEKPDSSEASQAQIEAISSGSPRRLTGMVATILSSTSWRMALTMSVAM
jgi:hypothetical protein